MQRLSLGAALLVSFGTAPTSAQNLFAPVAQVDEAVITEFEVQQRIRFLQVLNAPGADRQSALEALVQDRLRIAETRQAGITLAPDQLQTSLAEFAARANLTTEQLIEGLGTVGVSQETLRDFVATQVVWRDYIRARFGNRVQITEDQVDRATSSLNSATGIEVLLSEIIIPAPPNRAQAVLAQAEQIAQSTTAAEFSGFARRFSATASRGNGGRLPWTALNDLPASLRPLILALGPNEVTQPLPIPNAVALFQLRDIRETGRSQPEYAAIEYAAYYINGGRTPEALAIARDIERNVDRCDDLYGIAKGKPENVLDRGSLPPSEIPQDIAIELAKLDPGEVSTALTRAGGQTLVFLMLCGRTPQLDDEQGVDRESIAAELRNQRLTAFSDNLLAELEAEANIVFFE